MVCKPMEMDPNPLAVENRLKAKECSPSAVVLKPMAMAPKPSAVVSTPRAVD